ncbi:Pycsar system effector family protein [Streptomyces sp. NPDC002409]
MNPTASTNPTTSTESATITKNLDAGCADVAAEIARTDQKGSLLLAFDGAVLAGLASLADKDFALSAQIIGGAASLALTAAAVLLLLVVRPRLGGRTPVPGTFPYWAGMDAAAIQASASADTRAARIEALSTSAYAKYKRLEQAVDTILAALALLLAAAVLAVIG